MFYFSRKVAVVLEELGLTYHSVYLNFENNEHKAPEYTKYNPNGRIPAIIDHKNNDLVLWYVRATPPQMNPNSSLYTPQGDWRHPDIPRREVRLGAQDLRRHRRGQVQAAPMAFLPGLRTRPVLRAVLLVQDVPPREDPQRGGTLQERDRTRVRCPR